MAAKRKASPGFIVCRAQYADPKSEKFGTTDIVIAFPGHDSVFLYSVLVTGGKAEDVQVLPCVPLPVSSVADIQKRLEEEIAVREDMGTMTMVCREGYSLSEVQDMILEDFRSAGFEDVAVRAIVDLVGCFSSVSV